MSWTKEEVDKLASPCRECGRYNPNKSEVIAEYNSQVEPKVIFKQEGFEIIENIFFEPYYCIKQDGKYWSHGYKTLEQVQARIEEMNK